MIPLLVATALAAPHAEPVTWTVGEQRFEGTLVWDDASKAKRPGLLMVPNWYGATDTAVEKAKGIAGTRYVVLVADLYGAGVRPADDDAAGKAAGALYQDRAAMRARAAAALDVLRAHHGKAPVDEAKLAAIGFCFGGSAVLELGRSGADLDAVVSFHGGLATPSPAAPGALKGPVLVLNGAADGYVPAADIAAFEAEMTAAGADWQLVQLGGAVHCFTEVGAQNPGCSYDAKAARRAYSMMDALLGEAFGG